MDIVARIMCTDKKQYDGHENEKFAGWGVEHTVVDLFPHREIVVSATIEVERSTLHEMEHDVGAYHICGIGEGPGPLVSDPWQQVEKALE